MQPLPYRFHIGPVYDYGSKPRLFAANLENQVQISVYLKDGLTTEQVMSVGKRLKAMPEVKELEFTNKDQAMDKLKERMKDQPGILDALDGKIHCLHRIH